MKRNEFSIPAYSVTREAGGLRFRVPVKSERFRILLNLAWLLVWAMGESAIVRYLLVGSSPAGSFHPVSHPLAGLFLAAFTVAGGVVLWRCLWYMAGRETFLLAPDALRARREIWGIGRSQEFPLDKIESVKAVRLNYRVIYPSWGRRFIGHDENEIVIECAGRTYSYGKGLEEAEAADLVDLLREEMRFHYHPPSVPEVEPAFFEVMETDRETIGGTHG